MQLSTALSQVSQNNFTEFTGLSELLEQSIIDEALAQSGVVTIRKRKLPMEQMVWAVVGMALFRKMSIRQLVNQLDIILPNGEPYVAPSAVTQARKKLGHQAIENIFNQTQSLWHKKSAHPAWCGLTLLGVDVSEMKLAESLIETTPDYSLTLFDLTKTLAYKTS